MDKGCIKSVKFLGHFTPGLQCGRKDWGNYYVHLKFYMDHFHFNADQGIMWWSLQVGISKPSSHITFNCYIQTNVYDFTLGRSIHKFLYSTIFKHNFLKNKVCKLWKYSAVLVYTFINNKNRYMHK
jgi:hypothetical protein